MTKNHLKTVTAPKTWPVLRKASRFIIRPRSGGHRMDASLPLTVVIRDILGMARMSRGVRFILNSQEVLVNGVKQRRPEATIGLMDVLSFPAIKTSFRLLINDLNKLHVVPIAGKEASLIPSRVTSKTRLAGGRLQLGFHNGRTLLVEKDECKVGATVMLTLENTVDSILPFEKGAFVFITGGSHVGVAGVVDSFEEKRIIVKTADGTVQTLAKYAFVVGKGSSAIKLK